MQTYKYQFPASGDLSSEVDAEAFKEVLEEKLKKRAKQPCILCYVSDRQRYFGPCVI